MARVTSAIDELCREEEDQEEAADVRQLEPEEHRERGHGHQRRRPEEVPGLGSDRTSAHAVDRGR